MSEGELRLRIAELEKQNAQLSNQLKEANAYLKRFTQENIKLKTRNTQLENLVNTLYNDLHTQ